MASRGSGLTRRPTVRRMSQKHDSVSSSSSYHVFLDIVIDRSPVGRLIIKLQPSAPQSEWFASLCSGERAQSDAFRRQRLHLTGIKFRTVIPKFVAQAGIPGDVAAGPPAPSTRSGLLHVQGTLSHVAGTGDFFLCFADLPWLDSRPDMIPFGVVVDGGEVLAHMEHSARLDGKGASVEISASGVGRGG